MDYTPALGDGTGVGTYTRELVRALLAGADPEGLDLAAHVFRHPGWHRKMSRQLEGVPARWRPRPSRLIPHGALLEANRLFPLPAAEDLFGPMDVFHGTNFLAPPCRRARAVVTVHDLAFLHLGAEAPVAHRYHRYLHASLRRTERVIVPSACTRREVEELLDFPGERIDVVPLGAPPDLPGLTGEEFAAARRRLGLPGRYVLFLGTLEPRKNLPRLLRACRRTRGAVPGLVLAGRRGWHAGETLAEARETRKALPVALAGYVPAPLRNSLLRHATALVLPSLHEGFGLPLLEAFRAGTPVAASDGGAIPEVAGDAALLFPARDEEAMAEALVRIVRDGDLRRDLRLRGLRRVESFRWEETAAATRRTYEAARGGARSTSR